MNNEQEQQCREAFEAAYEKQYGFAAILNNGRYIGDHADDRYQLLRKVWSAAQAAPLGRIEQYVLQMAAISTAAIGYWKEGDDVHPDYDTVPLRDVAKLYAKYAALHDAAQAQPAQQPIGYLPKYELERLQSGHDANLRSAKFGPSQLDGDVPVYTEPPLTNHERIELHELRHAVDAQQAQPADAPTGRRNMSITVDVSEAKIFIENYAAEIDRLTAVATGIARAIWEEFYKETLPQWEPLQQDLSGVLSQISNLVAGLKQKPTNVHEAVNRFLAWPVPNTDRIGTHLLNADEARAMFLHCLNIDARPGTRQ